uniref:Peptidase C1 n=1 Tax=Thermodesulfobacterium geofontis TaxID=1295609 RepID=A0A7V5XHP7_9BACT
MKKLGLILVLMIFSIFYVCSIGFAQELKKAPLNPKFVKWLEAKKAGTLELKTEDVHPLGYIPPSFKFPKVSKSLGINLVEAQALPSKFDLRTVNGTTPVRDQGNCGSCWAFATMASLESYLKYKKSQTWNFSEQDLNQYHGFSLPECQGGNAYMSTAYLTRWSGPVKERDVPYPYVSATPGVPVVKHIQKVWFLPDPKNINAIKTAVYNYGAIYIAFYWDSAYYNYTTYAYYCNSTNYANHAVAIVGWDDNFPKENFKTQPPGNGAFIIKNSWGKSWGDSGYFYLSYYDKTLDEAVSFYNAQPTTNYERIYEYDPFGLVNAVGYSNSDTAWGANVFLASSNADLIKAVGFYALVPNTEYTIYIYDNLTNSANPRSGTLKKTVSGKASKPGYVTISVGDVKVTPNKRFSVVIKFRTPNYYYPVPVEERIWFYTDTASCGMKQSFISYDGSSWIDTCAYWGNDPYEDYNNVNVNIKAYAVKATQ